MASDIDKVADKLRQQGVVAQESEEQSNQPNYSSQVHSSQQYAQSVAQWLELYRAHYMTHYTMTVAPYYMAMGYAQAACQFMVNQSASGNLSSGSNASGVSLANQASPAGNAQNAGGTVLGKDLNYK